MKLCIYRLLKEEDDKLFDAHTQLFKLFNSYFQLNFINILNI